MKRSHDVRPQVRRDSLKFWHDVAESSGTIRADRELSRIKRGIRDVLATPERGKHREDVPDDQYHFFNVLPYVIAYTFDDRVVRVVRVLHGAQDFTQVFPPADA